MIKLFTKTTILTLLVCCTAFIAKAQLGYNYSQYDIGTSVSFDAVSGDALPQKTTQAINFNFTYNQTPYTNFVFEAQLGKLTGGDSLKSANGRYFNNDFYSFVFRGQLQFGELMDYTTSPFLNAVKNIYVSAGVGFIRNHITKIHRTSNTFPVQTTPGDTVSQEPFLPVRIGYEFKLFNKYEQPSVKFDIGYEANFIFGDDLDGFITGKHNDIYTQLCFGVKFAIGGGMTSYRKRIPF
jgi:hypothetical protein